VFADPGRAALLLSALLLTFPEQAPHESALLSCKVAEDDLGGRVVEFAAFGSLARTSLTSFMLKFW
jgi:hypothetical protein